ncbi:MAG TPA: hypothetical protein VFJ85_00250 [Acidimicrobiales bacterium]|nr:hypothetical protein [Acidimicrobiales bacterium]
MPERGSDALLRAWKNGVGIDEEVFHSVVEATKELDIQDILIKGQPRPDLLRASAATDDPERCGTVVTGLLAALKRGGGTVGSPVIRIFPRGIPWPEQFIIDITIGQQRAGF